MSYRHLVKNYFGFWVQGQVECVGKNENLKNTFTYPNYVRGVRIDRLRRDCHENRIYRPTHSARRGEGEKDNVWGFSVLTRVFAGRSKYYRALSKGGLEDDGRRRARQPPAPLSGRRVIVKSFPVVFAPVCRLPRSRSRPPSHPGDSAINRPTRAFFSRHRLPRPRV